MFCTAYYPVLENEQKIWDNYGVLSFLLTFEARCYICLGFVSISYFNFKYSSEKVMDFKF